MYWSVTAYHVVAGIKLYWIGFLVFARMKQWPFKLNPIEGLLCLT
jgi:hypothetical protein